MTATEILLRSLDERGVEYRFNEITKVFEWHFDGTDGEGSAHATEVNGGINIIACSLTPEQAIGATLGPVTLSASQVSNAVYVHSIHADCADADWQAIADELNATLGHSSNCTDSERTNAACKPTTYDNGYSMDHLEPGEYHEFWEPACACGNCGELIPMRKFCPNCGSRLVVDE